MRLLRRQVRSYYKSALEKDQKPAEGINKIKNLRWDCLAINKIFRMKKIFLIFLLFTGLYSCKKNTSICTNVTVTLKARSCNGVGVVINNKAYPTNDLPDSLSVEGEKLCIEHSLYDDPRYCDCCGGTYAHIIKIN